MDTPGYDPYVPRPGRWILRFLGLWLPRDAYTVFKVYYYLTYTFPIFVTVALSSMCMVDGHFNSGMLLNSLTTLLIICSPFIICRWYFYTGHYDDLVRHMSYIIPERIQKLTRIYTGMSLILWAGGFVFFYYHWYTLFTDDDLVMAYSKYSVFGVTLFYSIGWWSSWITIYAFICHLLYVKLHIFEFTLGETLSYSARTPDAEQKCVVKLLNEFNSISKILKQTENDFSKIISFSVFCHILDLFVFTTAYKCNHLGKYFTEVKYYGGVTFDLFSIFTKLYPASVVCEKLHQVVVHSGRYCYPDYESGTVLKDRLLFFQHIVLREQDLGLCILGVKITSKLLIGIFFTVSLTILRFLYYAVPILSRYFAKL